MAERGAPPVLTAQRVVDLLTTLVSVVGGWWLVRATDQLGLGVGVGSTIVAASRMLLGRLPTGGNRTVFLVAVLFAVASYSFFLAHMFRTLES